MNQQEIYERWAPSDSPWSPWIKPVLFTQLSPSLTGGSTRVTGLSSALANSLAGQRLAIIVDLPGERAVAAGLQLAQVGYRPVPLFNTSFGANSIVEVTGILRELLRGGDVFPSLSIPANAPPAFLLDSARMRERGRPLPGKYDNRWLVFPQDFPSSRFLRSQQIDGVVVLQESSLSPAEDLAHVLLRWQEDSIPLLATRLDSTLLPSPMSVQKPSRYRALWYHFLATLGLRRNSAGGFGAVVPLPSQGSGFS